MKDVLLKQRYKYDSPKHLSNQVRILMSHLHWLAAKDTLLQLEDALVVLVGKSGMLGSLRLGGCSTCQSCQCQRRWR